MIKIHNLEKSFGNNHVLNGVNIEITRGECVCVIGPSGSGKSTLGQCLNGIIPNIYKGEHSGSLILDGQEAFDL